MAISSIDIKQLKDSSQSHIQLQLMQHMVLYMDLEVVHSIDFSHNIQSKDVALLDMYMYLVI
jgi:hypothetical protein